MLKSISTALSILLSGFIVMGCAACASEPSGGDETPDESKTITREILSDTHFEEGVKVSGLESQSYAYTWWKYEGTTPTVTPLWSLGQYCNLARTREGYDTSRNDLSLKTLIGDGNGIVGKEGDADTLTNISGSKLVKLTSERGKAELIVDTSKEYIDQETGEIVPRREGEDWVHLILSGTSEVVYPAKIKALTISADVTVSECSVMDNLIGADQLQWIFQVRDMGSSAVDYFWFSITLFDNRYEVFPGAQSFDGGKEDATGKFIYAPSGEALFGAEDAKMQTGVCRHMEIDIAPLLHEAFLAAKEKGALTQAQWENMAVNGFNLGWEVSNVAKVGAVLENLSIKVTQEQET